MPKRSVDSTPRSGVLERRLTALETPWWVTASWSRYLRDLLLFRSRRRYALSVATTNPLGATDPHTFHVEVNPRGIPWPSNAATRWHIRHCPVTRDAFEQAVTVGLVEHEAGHIRHSGEKPPQSALGWLWNALEDERMERRLAARYPDLVPLFDLVGDAVLVQQAPTTALLDACLVWRFEHDRTEAERRFRPASPQAARQWDEQIRPLVEAAWAAPDSDQVIRLARHILQLLELPEDAPLPDHLPAGACTCGGGEAQGHEEAPVRDNGPDASVPDVTPVPPPDARLPGRTSSGRSTAGGSGAGVGSGHGHDPDDPAQADPCGLLATVEGAARDLARWLVPLQPQVCVRPHPDAGELDLERALETDDRPFDGPVRPAPRPPRAWYVIVDVSSSMGAASDPRRPMHGARLVVMWLDRAAELAQVPLGIAAFDGGVHPIRIRPLSRGADPLARRRIAGLDHGGGTLLWPALEAASQALLAAAATRRVLVVLHDGQLAGADASRTRQLVGGLARAGIQLLPLYLGAERSVVAANTAIFGRVLACTDLAQLTVLVRTWLRAIEA